MLLEDDDIRPILLKVRDEIGIDFTQYRENTLRRRLNRRIMARSCANLTDYLSLLSSDPAEYKNLLSSFTIKYTEFFRDPVVFSSIDSVVFTSLRERLADADAFTAWSAGCATGEEAYSLLSLVKRLRGECLFDNFRVIGTDIDPDALRQAQSGYYNKDLMPVPVDAAALGFIENGSKIEVPSDIKEHSSFIYHNLLSPNAIGQMQQICPNGFDLILCRNVLIYLHREAQAVVTGVLRAALKPGGFMVLGTREVISAADEQQLVCVDRQNKIFQKIVEQ